MPDYKAMYFQLAARMADAIELLTTAQLAAEEAYVNSQPTALMLLSPDNPAVSGQTARERVMLMPKDSQLDPKAVRAFKAKGGPTMAQSALDGESRSAKTQSGNRHQPNDDKARGK